MRHIRTDKELKFLEERVVHYANEFNRTLPEMRFFILDEHEFASLLSKKVYPHSPSNIWEGKDMVSRRLRVESGQESSLYYEVVQTGRPSYAYLNETNSPMMQASVMAHVVGHCEFSELNVMNDSDDDRSEIIMHLCRKVNLGKQQMGQKDYIRYWNACESAVPLIQPNSQYNLSNSIELDHESSYGKEEEQSDEQRFFSPFSSTMDVLLKEPVKEQLKTLKKEQKRRIEQQDLNRKGYRLKAPCQDIMGFLREFAQTSNAEKAILDYIYEVHHTHDFVIRTQIMNEGWAMYWEKKIMLELFREKACTGIIDYSKTFSGVCYPRPWFQRNPYHLGYHMWLHIEKLFADGKVSSDYIDETDLLTKSTWHRPGNRTPMEEMEHLVSTVTDYEFLRRFLNNELIEEFHLNRIHKQMAQQIGITAQDVYKEDRHYVWLQPDPIKDDMLNFFTHLHRPRIYLIDVDFMDGGLLLYHRDDGRSLRYNWIKPTLKNINLIWKGSVSLLSKDTLFTYSSNSFKERKASVPDFELVNESIQNGTKPFRL